jgi:hypothetical protein
MVKKPGLAVPPMRCYDCQTGKMHARGLSFTSSQAKFTPAHAARNRSAVKSCRVTHSLQDTFCV